MKTYKLTLRMLEVALLAVIVLAATSCDDEEYYFSDLVGSWQSVESGGQPFYDYTVYATAR